MNRNPEKVYDPISMCDSSTVVEGIFVCRCSACRWKKTKPAKVTFRSYGPPLAHESCPKCGSFPLSISRANSLEKMIYAFLDG